MLYLGSGLLENTFFYLGQSYLFPKTQASIFHREDTKECISQSNFVILCVNDESQTKISSQREDKHVVGYLIAFSTQRCKQEAFCAVNIASMNTNGSVLNKQFVLKLDEAKISS